MVTAGIVEDQAEIREGLIALLEQSERFRCVGAWGSMEEGLAALEAPGAALPDVLLVDLGLPGMPGTEGIRRLKGSRPGLLTVVLTVHEDDDRIFDALCAGACGYLLKKTPDSEILKRLEEAVAGGAPISPEIARQVVNLFARFTPSPGTDHDLTPHEVRVLKLFVDGHNYRTAGSVLGVTRSTVAFHVRKIYEKLAVHSKSEAVAKALRDGLLR